MTPTAKPVMIATALPTLFAHAGMEYYLVGFSFEGVTGAQHTSLEARDCLLAAGHVPAEVRDGKLNGRDVFKEPALIDYRGWVSIFNFREKEDEDKILYLTCMGGNRIGHFFYSIHHGGGNRHHPALCQRPAA